MLPHVVAVESKATAPAPEEAPIPEEDPVALARAAEQIRVDRSLFLDDLPAHYASARAFYQSIGSPVAVVAPMVHQSEHPFRMVVRRHGAELCYTPMIHSGVYARNPRLRARFFTPHAADRPLFAQFCGDDADVILEGALLTEGEIWGWCANADDVLMMMLLLLLLLWCWV